MKEVSLRFFLALVVFGLLGWRFANAVPCDAAGQPAGCTDCADAANAADNDCLCAGADPVADGCVTCQEDATTPNCLDCAINANADNDACVAYCEDNPTDAVCPTTPANPTRKIRFRLRNVTYVVRRRIRRKQTSNGNNNGRPSVTVINLGK